MRTATTFLQGHSPLSAPLFARDVLLSELERGLSSNGIRHRRRARYRRSVWWTVALRATSALRRLLNFLLAAALLVVLSPLLAALFLIADATGGGIRRQQRLGRWAIPFTQYTFSLSDRSSRSFIKVFRHLPAIYNVLKGDMSFVGPRAAELSETFAEQQTAWRRYDIRPGLLSPWWLRKRANIAFGSEARLDLEYVETNTLRGDIGLAFRAIPSALFPSSDGAAPEQLNFLGVRIDNLTMSEAAKRLAVMARGTQVSQACFVNADCVNLSFRDREYRTTLTDADIVLADGIGVRVAGMVLNQNVRENVNGTDLLPYLCEIAEKEQLSIYLLGGKPGVSDCVSHWMRERYPQLRLAGSRDGYFSPAQEHEVIAAVRNSHADIVLVALGAPRQDKWIASHKHELGAKVSVGVGGLFDFYSGRIPRAPIWMRELGLEWLYRFWQEPRRMWRRYLVGNVIFLGRVVLERTRFLHVGRAKGSVS